jgi:hypothetical protein
MLAETSGMGRRSLVKGAAWTTPIVVVGAAAPAVAVSQVPCLRVLATIPSNWDNKKPPLAFPGSSVTATVTFTSNTGDNTPGDTGDIDETDYQPSWRFIKLHHPDGMDQGDTVRITLTFTAAVTNVSMTVTDIDKDTGEWIDEVIVNTPGYTYQAGANVIGTGTALSPFKSNHEGGITSAAGDVTVSWAGPLTSVALTYRAADSQNGSGSGQHIGIGLFGFDSC